MPRSLSSFIPSLFPLIPVALVAISVGCGSTVIGGGVEDEDGMSCGSVIGENGEVVRNPLCDTVEDGYADGQDGVANDGSDGSDGEPLEPQPTSLAIERDDLVILQFGSFALSCAVESPGLPECGGGIEQYLLEVEMPASYLTAGVVDFADPAVSMYTQVAGSDDGGACTYFGGGSGFGSMQIHEVGDDVIDITVNDAFMTLDTQSGRFEVTRCTPGGGGTEVGTLNIEANGQGTLDVLFVNTNYDLLNGAHTVLLCE